jgi:mRNA-degrading endonuclease RelE of RelBE toxin-antitoxin system
MRYDIVLAPEAVEDLNTLKSHPQYRLRVGDDIRVFYDVSEKAVQVLAVVPKSDADTWLAKHGESDETSGSVGNQG